MNRLLTIVDSKYQRLEYLESTGTQYIDTGILANNETGIQIDVQYLNTRDSVAIGSRTQNDTDTRFYIGSSNGTGYISWNILGLRFTTIERKICSMNLFNNRKKIVNGSFLEDITTTLEVQNSNITLFCANINNSPSIFSTIKLYSSQITQGNQLVRNFVPVLRKTDNELGMLDLVEGKFYTNAGTGKFTANLDTMYAIIQGSPTQSPYGVFSGFSKLNYLTASKPSSITTFELNIKFSFSDLSNYQFIFGDTIYNGIQIQKNDDTNNTIRLRYCNGSSAKNINILSNPSLDTNYIFNIKVNGTSAIVSYNIEGQQAIINNYTLDFVPAFGTSDWIFGRRDADSDGVNNGFLKGSIDLNRSYIKIDNTKYNLQAVVGYTIVGSPTITDGVVSGLAYNDYLKINGTYVISSNSNIEFNIRFKVSVLTGNKALFNIGSLWNAPLISVYNNYISGLLIGDMGFENGIEADTYYRLKISMNNGVSKGYLYNDDMSLRAKKTQSLSFEDRTGNIFIGAPYGSSNPTVDSIDLNNTYIKLDNKLWFNGQEE